MIKAFLLTRQSFDTGTGVQLVFWFQSETGPVKVIVNGQQPVFFIRQQDMALAKELLISFPGVAIKPLELKSFGNEAIAGIYFKSQQRFYRGRELLQQNAIRCFEADVRAAERFLTERFLTGPVSIHLDQPADVPPRLVKSQSYWFTSLWLTESWVRCRRKTVTPLKEL